MALGQKILTFYFVGDQKYGFVFVIVFVIFLGPSFFFVQRQVISIQM